MDGLKSVTTKVTAGGAGVTGAVYLMHQGLAGVLFVMVLAVLACLPQLTDLYREFNTRRETRWVLDDDRRTNRDIARRTGVPLPPPERDQLRADGSAPRRGILRKMALRWFARRPEP